MNEVGRKVLIKTVVTTIMIYAMSIFQLPKTWCAEINAMMATFGGDIRGPRTRFIGRVGVHSPKQKTERGVGFR